MAVTAKYSEKSQEKATGTAHSLDPVLAACEALPKGGVGRIQRFLREGPVGPDDLAV